MSGKLFIDTNILIYAHDLDAGSKHEVARSPVRDLWENQTGVISTQVLQEFYLKVTRKIAILLSPPQARGILKAYAAWQVEITYPEDVL